MTKKELYLVATKLMGVYFAVYGIVSLCSVLFYFFGDLGLRSLRVLVTPALYLVASFLLMKKTDWCLSKLGLEAEENITEQSDGDRQSTACDGSDKEGPSRLSAS